jgi:hypothetical protein
MKSVFYAVSPYSLVIFIDLSVDLAVSIIRAIIYQTRRCCDKCDSI